MDFDIVKRALVIRGGFCLVALILAARLWNISIAQGDLLSAKADAQNTISIQTDDNRADITDRNMRLMTGVNHADYMVIFPLADDNKNFEMLSDVISNTDSDFYFLFDEISDGRSAVCKLNKNYDESITQKYNNIKIITKKQRYLDDSPCASVIGYLSDGRGKTGLEYVYDSLLGGFEANCVNVGRDALRRIIPGYAVNVSDKGTGTYTLKTTLDLEYSRICKNVLEKSGITGAAVLLDVNSFDILAAESSPSYNPERVEEYLTSDGGRLINRCVQNYDAGSVFKIIVAAAALEKGVVKPGDRFYCDGRCEVAGKSFACHNENGHGYLTFEEGFAASCNTVFIEVGLKTGYSEIIKMAERFGIGSKAVNPTKFEQKSGKLPDAENYFLADVANVSIGQGALSLTPVHGAVISAVIASGGIKRDVNIVDSVVNSVGGIEESLRAVREERIITEETANEIYKMMIKTNKEGTGTTGNIDVYGSGGKTGSAQTGWYVDGERYQHGWFTGFFPAQKPQYALCIFAENGKSGSLSAAPLFKDTGSEIMKINNEVTAN